jgi:transposase-like protein
LGVQLLVEMARARVGRDEWRRRIDRWKDSGLTAKEFAAELGINAGTLQVWRYKLRGDRRQRPRTKASSDTILSSLVEVRPPVIAGVDHRLEIEVANGRRVRVGIGFDVDTLRALLAVLETA